MFSTFLKAIAMLIFFFSCTSPTAKKDSVELNDLEIVDSQDEIDITKDDSEPEGEWSLNYVNKQITKQVGNASIYVDLIGMDSMSLINWQGINPIALNLFFPESQITNLELDFKKFDNLESLILGKTHLSEIPKSIGKLKHLKKLHISGSQIQEVPIELCALTNLEELTIWRSKLITLPPEISQLTKLRYMNLIENNFSKEEQSNIKQLLPQCEIRFQY